MIDKRNLAPCDGIDCLKRDSCQRFKNAREYKHLICDEEELMMPLIAAPCYDAHCPHFYPIEEQDQEQPSRYAGSVNPMLNGTDYSCFGANDNKMSAQARMEYSVSVSMAADCYYSMRDRLKKLQNRYQEQCWELSADRKACRVITRCIKYGDRIPRKYRRKYALVFVALRKYKSELIDSKC